MLPAAGTLYVSPRVVAFRERTIGPSGGQGLFVQGDYDGRLSSRGETIQLLDVGERLVAELTTPSVQSDVQKYLRATEIHYHPGENDPDEMTEFIELMNTSQTNGLDLRGVRITQGPSQPFEFSSSEVTSLGPGEFVLVVRDASRFRDAYPNVDPARIAGEYQGRLSNGGETVKIEDARNGTVLQFSLPRRTGG